MERIFAKPFAMMLSISQQRGENPFTALICLTNNFFSFAAKKSFFKLLDNFQNPCYTYLVIKERTERRPED